MKLLSVIAGVFVASLCSTGALADDKKDWGIHNKTSNSIVCMYSDDKCQNKKKCISGVEADEKYGAPAYLADNASSPISKNYFAFPSVEHGCKIMADTTATTGCEANGSYTLVDATMCVTWNPTTYYKNGTLYSDVDCLNALGPVSTQKIKHPFLANNPKTNCKYPTRLVGGDLHYMPTILFPTTISAESCSQCVPTLFADGTVADPSTFWSTKSDAASIGIAAVAATLLLSYF